MKTTLDLQTELLNEAMQISHIKTKVVIRAPGELARMSTLSDLKTCKGTIDLDIDLNTLRDRRWLVGYRLKSTLSDDLKLYGYVSFIS